MSLCGQAVRTTNATINQPMLEIIAGASSRLAILELAVMTTVTSPVIIGVGRSDAVGVTPTTPVLLQRFDPAEPACAGKTALAWGGTPPTFPTYFMRRYVLPATPGQGVLWTWPKGLVVPVNGSAIIANLSASFPCDVNLTAEES